MEAKPGIKSTEFWITTVVAVLSVVTAALVSFFGSEEAFPAWAKAASVLAGAGLSVFAAMGYNKGRAAIKVAEIEYNTPLSDLEE